MLDEATKLSRLLPKKEADYFAKDRRIETVADLLAFWPRRYKTYESDLGRFRIGQYVTVVATVKSATSRPQPRAPRRKMLKVVLTDGRQELDVTFFSAWTPEKELRPGVRAIFAGEIGMYNQRWQLTHPGYSVLDDDDSGERKALIPFYRKVGRLSPWTVAEAVRTVLDVIDVAPEVVPEDVLDARDLLGRLDALRAIHTPDSRAEVEAGQRRMRYEEAFVLQLVLARRRAEQQALTTRGRSAITGGILDAFDARLPFTLTAGQERIGGEIADDLARETPMHRLLQGEVGSGKTLVALRAMLAVVDSGGQAALLAPTEVLAQQHHRSITRMLGDLAAGGLLGGADQGTRVALLTGSMSTAERRAALLEIASGQAGIVIGTHALLQDNVQFADLALVVVDEQHRFGVEQRDALRAKGTQPPHVLVMTATPIPRTVAMTVFGDLETSTLRELPAGRAPITSHVVPEWKDWFPRTWQRVAEEVRLGRQVYVVCPRIGGDADGSDDLDGADIVVPDRPSRVAGPDGHAGSDADDGHGEGPSGEGDDLEPPGDIEVEEDRLPRPLHGVVETLAQLQAEPALAGVRMAMLHGRMPSEDKDSTMLAFAAGEVDVLVSTTVIEVGVDVHNASMMVILDADRFGVSQLHQLRGRVGRGGLPGLCLLVSGTPNDQTGQRLESVAATLDGFELARLDLSQRREGDILGAAQHGSRTQLEFLHVLEHEDLIEAAREDAFALVAADPTLAAHPDLKKAVDARVDAEQAAYLERG
ncbi:MAG: ATP-dependent DNA helicase RecG [Phycicoccus sp.]|uniref:ATP-dependent DNA helicase RecG n=1 Tax=Phycicoccus sp. TaxID=1902410 RepID=UPI0025848552|nr:ATP-dependent DNA helicase RecG [Phycicoccus sp.]MCO5303616.1 ATP-dependent DNA helicase RecG [Phycicoccus sp.]